jgi:hypothetical protein
MKMKDFGLRVVVLVLVTCCLAALSFAVPLTGSNPDSRAYDPLLDMNNDGTIDIFDTIIMAGGFGGSGAPATKAVLLYDSGWINISDKAGQDITVTHNLDTMDGIVDITGKTKIESGPHQIQIGGSEHKITLGKLYGGFDNDVAYSLVQTSDNGYVMLCKGFAGLIKTDVNGSLEWTRDYALADPGFAWARGSVIKTDDGGFAIVGSSYNTTTFKYSPLLIKTDSNGNMVWNRTYGSGGDANQIVQTADGGYAIAGSYGPNRDKTWLIKTDQNGNFLWEKTYEIGMFSVPCGVFYTNDGGYVVGGTRYETDYHENFYLVKTDSTGNIQWNKTYVATASFLAFSMVQTNDAGYAMYGLAYPENQVQLVKTDSNGVTQWNMTYDGAWTSDGGPGSIVQTADGGYLVAAPTWPGGSNVDVLLIKTDGNGKMLWNKTCGGENGDLVYSLIRTNDGGYAFAGLTGSFGAYGRDVWLMKIDADGNVQWTKSSFKYGLAWVDSSPNSITLARGEADLFWNFVRVRIWKPRN